MKDFNDFLMDFSEDPRVEKKKEAKEQFENDMTDEQREACKKAMDYLMDLDKTEWQVRSKLLDKGFSEEDAEVALSYVRAYGYVDDYKYAVRFINIYSKKRSNRRIREDLKKRHVPEATVDLAFEEAAPDENAALTKDLKKILEKYDVDNLEYADKQKIMAKVYRKGYSPENIRKVLYSLTNED
ncbi:MAG: recombination regulator RecX [Lachnospiraceae bacterium]|nr:recombination regulator RecX [Lachnospiraceae bacterium]